jgi:hypothetical protein
LHETFPSFCGLVVDEEVLRRQIQAELTKGLEEEMKVKRQEFEKQ